MASIESGLTLPLIGHLYDHTGATFKQSFRLLNTPDLSLAINGQGASSITLELDAALSGGNAAPAKGDILTLTEDGGDGSVVLKGIVEDFPDERGTTTAHEILVNPVGVQLGDTPFTTNYTSATDIGQMARDVVTACPNLSYDATSIPLVGATAIFDFSGTSGYTCLTALEELRKMAGSGYYFWPDTAGKVWFKAANIAGAADHSVMVAPNTEARKYKAPVAARKNIVTGYGAVTSGAPLTATYDNSAGSPLGKRALVPPLTYSKLTDLTTLQTIVNTVGSLLDREHVTVELELVNYPKRVQPGDVLRYFEETVNERAESAGWPATGAYSPNYVVLSARQNGPRQSVVVSDVPFSVNDLQYLIDSMIAKTASGSVAAIAAGSPGSVSPVMIGSTVPATPAAPTLSTAVERVSQADNADVTVSWLANAPGDYVVNYKVRWRQGSGPYAYIDAGGGSLSLTVHGLAPGVSYGFSVAAVNKLGNISAYSTEATITTASDSTAPATPTGLSATKTPRGALVSWNANTEADLQGYELQVSVGGGGYVAVTPGPTLVTSLAYVAPSGTAQGTSLQFQVRALDWSGNASAWSAASVAVNTDGVVFDELLAGSLKVYGSLTTGGLQTAASGKRLVLDGTSLRLYDGSTTDYGAPSGVGVTVELTAQGAGFFQGTVSASKVYASTVATSATMGQTGAGAGFKLSADSATPYLDFFTAGSTIAGSRFFYAKDSASPFAVAGILAANVMTFALGAADSVSEAITTTGGPIIADALAIATFKPSGTVALKALGSFLSTSGGSITPQYAQATTAGDLLVAWVGANAATPPSINTTATGWSKAVAAYGSHVEVDIWYKANCAAGETPPTFTATLVAPSAADSITETITATPGLSSNVNNAVMASFSPASPGTPIALVKAGAFTTGTATQVSPAFGQPTTNGNFLTALVSGQIGTTGGGTAYLGDTGAATYSFNFSGSGSDNIIFMGPFTMPQHGTASSVSIYMGGHTASVNTIFCVWNAAGSLVASSSETSLGTGRSLKTLSVSAIDLPSGSQYFIGFWRQQNQDAEWGVTNGGSFKFMSSTGSDSSVAGYSNCTSPYVCGNMQCYLAYSIVSPGTDITTTASGWTKAVQALNNGTTTFEETQIWYKPNCGSAEPAPVFTSSYGTEVLYAQLAEFSGVATTSPLDKTGSFLQGAAASSMTVAGSAADAQSGDLVLTATRWILASAGTASFSDSENNATGVSLGNSGSQSVTEHANFTYAIVPVPAMHAQLAEFSGVATSSPLDKTGSASQTGSAASILATASGADSQAGNLILVAGRWQQTGNSTASWLDSINNATAVNAGSSGTSSLSQHSNFTYGIVSGSTTGEVLQLSSFVGLEAQTTDNSNGRGFISTQYSTDATGASFIGRKARGVVGAPTAIANGDQISAQWAQAFDGTNWINTGRATFDVNGAVSGGNVPTDFNIRLNPGSGEFVALRLGADKSVHVQSGPLVGGDAYISPTIDARSAQNGAVNQWQAAGLGNVVAYTPRYTGRVKIRWTWNVSNNTSGMTTWTGGGYGTGTAPIVNATTGLGTQYGPAGGRMSGFTNGTYTYAGGFESVITGLTIGTAYWFDLWTKVNGGTGTWSEFTVVVEEF